ncbi:MAG: response regulator transcription factor, partial [Dehalococcoidia bacterium]
NPASALACHRAALTIYQELNNQQGIAESLRALASLATEWRQPTVAAQLFAVGEILSTERSSTRPAFAEATAEQSLELLRSQLQPELFASSWGAGRAMRIEDAIGLALQLQPPNVAPASLAHDVVSQPEHTVKDLTERELQVLRLIAAGRSNKEMARELSLSARTIERHITNIYAKIGARGKADAIAYALRSGYRQ